MDIRDFETLVDLPEPPLDELALALATKFRTVDSEGALAELDRLGAELEELAGTASPQEQAEACRLFLGERCGFMGERDRYDHPDNSMLDLVLERRRGLPILLSIVYVETARRAGFTLGGVGLPGHYVVGHFGADPPLLLDPFSGGVSVSGVAPEVAAIYVRPWTAHETGLRILNNLTAAYSARADFVRAIRAAELRLLLPLDEPTRTTVTADLRALQARLN
ncbi:MAG: transglutaminase-like domain-containing protein [Actinomycetota bacterium]|nr:transglutaminase-like domain-containing protein [Actinomycetota bacterium]